MAGRLRLNSVAAPQQAPVNLLDIVGRQPLTTNSSDAIFKLQVFFASLQIILRLPA